jgi:hypothetical protein
LSLLMCSWLAFVFVGDPSSSSCSGENMIF